MPDVLASPMAVGKPKKLLEQTRDVLRLKPYSIRTERTDCDWIERFIRFHQKRHPSEMNEVEVSEFLTHLARDGKVAASTQNQALSALLFLYQQVLKQEIGWMAFPAPGDDRLPLEFQSQGPHPRSSFSPVWESFAPRE